MNGQDTSHNSDERSRANRVGIITLPGETNYGNRLQLYASVRILAKLGFSGESLLLKKQDSVLQHPKTLLKRAAGRPTSMPWENELRIGAFRRFGKLTPTREICSIDEIERSDYSFFAVGSDQVWNPNYIFECGGGPLPARMYHYLAGPKAFREEMDWYFLRFAERDQRVTISPSIGLNGLDRMQSQWLAKGLLGFERLSVREARGAEIIRECTGREATVTCDPTLVLLPEEWLSVADDRLVPDYPYVFSYLLGNNLDSYRQPLDLVTHGGKIPVIAQDGPKGDFRVDMGPAEFLSLIKNASHVITDSFHASLFSSLFETPLTIVVRDGGENLFSRLSTLSEMLGIQDKNFRPGRDKYDESASKDFEGVADRIDIQRTIFMNFLDASLDIRQ